MTFDGSHDDTGRWHLDARALRFALIFPALLAVALVVGGVLMGPELDDGVLPPWGGGRMSLTSFLVLGAATVIVLGAGIGFFGARTTLPRPLRRILLGVAMALQLGAGTLFAATLLGQASLGGLPSVRVDGYVLLMGTGLSAAMGLVLALTFKPDEQWTAGDDAAFARALASEADPTAANDTMAYLIHPRSSVIMMIVLAALLPGALLALLSPWILLALAVAALIVIVVMSAVVDINRRQLSVKVLGIIPVLVVPCEHVAAAVSLDIVARDYGGWGLRRHSGSATYLTYSGAAVVLRMNDGGKVAVSAPNLDVADDLSAILNRRAGKTPAQH